MTVINKHHQKRKEGLIKAIQKASTKADQAWMYLTANNDVPPEQLADMTLAQVHLEIALGHLGVTNTNE